MAYQRIRRLFASLAGPRNGSKTSAPAESPLTRDHIIWSYRLFLEREPENEQVIEANLRELTSVQQLRTNFLISNEFLQRNTALPEIITSNVVIKEIDEGLRLFVDISDYDIGMNIILGLFEQSELQFVRNTVRSGQTALDIGANIGFFAMHMAHLVGPEGHVYAFEPLPRNASLLERSVAENGFAGRVTVERAAVGAEPGEIELISPRTTHNWGGPYLRTAGQPVPDGHVATPVPLIQLDRYPLRRPVDFIKIDVEGAELLALRGARAILMEDRPVILAEINPPQLPKVSGCTPNDLIAELRTYGYSCHLLASDGAVGERMTHDETAEIKNVVFLAEQARIEQ